MTSQVVRLPTACGALLLSLLAAPALAGQPPQEAIDPALEAAVRQYFATQEAEDAAAYLALWAPARRRGKPVCACRRRAIEPARLRSCRS